MRRENALILMAKAPIPGMVKTRMRPGLTPQRAAELYSCMLADTAREAATLGGERLYLFYMPPEGRRHFLSGPFLGFRLREQKGNDLGERVVRAMGEAFSEGARSVVVVGGDCPALSAARMRAAFRELADRAETVFGPADDGGFYLAGLNAAAPSLFSGIEWSTGRVLEEILSRCRHGGMAYALLPPESDVDTAEDLGALRAWAGSHRHPACSMTRNWLRKGTARVTSSPDRTSSGRRPAR